MTVCLISAEALIKAAISHIIFCCIEEQQMNLFHLDHEYNSWVYSAVELFGSGAHISLTLHMDYDLYLETIRTDSLDKHVMHNPGSFR